MTLASTAALDPIDEFIAIADRTAAVPALREGKLPAASAALCDVAKRLLAANQHMASWISRFTSFAIGGADAADRFRWLRDEFNVYMIESSRINIAGINHSKVDYVADSIAAVLR